MTGHKLAAVLILVLLQNVVASAQQPETHIYSNVEYNKQGGDLVGFELQLTTNGPKAKGSMKIYEGGCATPIDLAGSLAGNNLELTAVTEDYGKIEVKGTLRMGALDGRVRFEKTAESETLHLKEISKPHC